MSGTAEKILNIAEKSIREGGVHAFSFRKIADELGIKSASVHYHFATKEALLLAVSERYTRFFFQALSQPEEHKDALGHYVSVFSRALAEDGKACLCGILAAESGQLDPELRKLLREFEANNIAWLKKALAGHQKREALASVVFFSLEGAMTFAALTGDLAHFTKVGKTLRSLIAE